MSVNIKYKNNSIATMSDTGTKTLKTSGKYCEGDIVIENVQDGGCTIKSGSFTPASGTTYGYTVTHGLGKIPKVFVCWISENLAGSAIDYYLYGIYSNSLNINEGLSYYNPNVTINREPFNNITETTIHLVNTDILTTKTYSWIAVG